MPLARPSNTPAPVAHKAETGVGALMRQGDLIGDSADAKAVARLNAALAELKAVAIAPLLKKAVQAVADRDMAKAGELAIQALEVDESNGYAWYVLAIAREGMSDFRSSLHSYEAALKLMPADVSVANDLGRLAARMDMPEVAEKLFRLSLRQEPGNTEAINNLACMVRDQSRGDEAIEILREGIMANPEVAVLWATLASVLSERGDAADSLTFYDEAVRLDPSDHKAYYNRATALLSLDRAEDALRDCETGLKGRMVENERSMMELARSTILLALGRLGEGWDAYEARLSPHYSNCTQFLIERPAWTPQTDLEGKSLLLFGEQGLGDEILFANVLPDVVEALGPEGKLQIAVQNRLVPLFARSFPTATVVMHKTAPIDGHSVRFADIVGDREEIDCWAPIASLLRRFRRSVADYPDRPAFLTPDTARVAHWKSVLADAPAGPKVGILWKSLKINSSRARHYSPFHDWAPILATPGVTFVNLQYGDCAEEIALAREQMGVEIWEPPGIDLKNDLDDLAALCCAMDIIIGPANATINIAAACGAPVWLISTPGSWTRLGTERHPWYPTARVFIAPAFNDWEPVMNEIADALREAF